MLCCHLPSSRRLFLAPDWSKTGLGKSTIGRIKKEVEGDKEKSKGGCPSKLSSIDKQSIICQITSGRLDNAVEATHFINNILPNPITPQTVRNALKENRSEEHTSELQSHLNLVCRLLLEKKKKITEHIRQYRNDKSSYKILSNFAVLCLCE